jgi:hypothetical protein
MSAMVAISPREKSARLAAARLRSEHSVTGNVEINVNADIVDDEAEKQNVSFNEWCRDRSGRKLNQEL